MFGMELAGIRFAVKNQYSFVEKYCEDYGRRIPAGEEDCRIELTGQECEERLLRARQKGRREYPLWYYEAEALFRRVALALPSYDALFLHSALLEVKGRGFGLVAPSGGGKTVQMNLWRRVFPEDTRVINGDKPIYRLREGEVWGYGSPWRGKEALGQGGCAPVEALFFLRKGEAPGARLLTPAAVMGEVFYHMELPLPGQEEALSRVLASLLQRVPCYELTCTMGQETVELAEGILEGRISDL